MKLKKLLIIFVCVFSILNIFIFAAQAKTVKTDKIIVAVIDSKINIKHKYIKNYCLFSKSFIIDKSNDTGHGTAVAGAAVKYSSFIAQNLWDSSSNIKILPIEINVLDIQTDYGEQMGNAIQYAIDSGAKVINMSFSSSSPNKYVYEKIRNGLEKGVVFVSAAGNSGYDIYSFPAAYDGVISVGSCGINEDGTYYISKFSNCNDDVDLLMEGEKILLLDSEDGFVEKTGTSFSSGKLSGIIGELIYRYPKLNSEDIVYALYDTALSIENDKGSGHGVVDLYNVKKYLNELNSTGKSSLGYSSAEYDKLINMLYTDTDNSVSVGRSHTVYIENNEVKVVGNTSSNRAAVWKWKDLIKVYAGNDNTAAINSSNLPMATGYNVFNKNIFRGWTDIDSLSLSPNFTAGLTTDGKVYVTDYLQGKITDEWKDIVQISTGAHHLVGLTKDGRVLTTGYNIYGQMDTKSWRNIIKIASNSKTTVGLTKDGKIVVSGH
ncbi:hypothetical protein J2Z76_000309 [Sedimentibacter acidaminivorans]|uniref:Peptidase S8/S53 domain-containing protein n=1 Tax=Sedimentibacter acidaminivorans TaxID=913099 RepID=A0ABS4G9V4_9FIRM|nr:S8 family serine peptidase [Sedimentibacter acidaminivorans]MBP1924456.1 hypothetical protein [Sedimentibacter acidaminivorans]